jgi:hypothetical protein
MIQSGGLEALMDYFNRRPNCRDIVHGALLGDNLKSIATSLKPI